MNAEEEIRANWAAQVRAMDDGDTETLAECFIPDATLIHMTGYQQPVDEWFAGMRRREFVYHRVVEHSVVIDVRSERTAGLIGRITTGVTDDGSGQAWPLRVEQDFEIVSGVWLCTRSRVAFDS